jgi:hypothetical protein
MDIFFPIAGTLVVVAVMLDIFFTALYPASDHGFIRKAVSRSVWLAFRRVGEATGPRRRRNLLAYNGPCVVVATLAAWLLLLIIGWAMIFFPGLGTAIRATSGGADTGWVAAVYFSGFNLTTLGVGDLVPLTGGYRLLTVLEAACGFTFFTAVISYFLSIYGNLVRRSAFALGLHHRTFGSGDAGRLLAGHAGSDGLATLNQRFSKDADELRQIHQSLHSYPVLRHFHYRDPHNAIPQMLLTILDSVTLARSVLPPAGYSRTIGGVELRELEQAGMALLLELAPRGGDSGAHAGDAHAWRLHHARVREQLQDAGVEVRADAREGADEYAFLRAHWDSPLRALASEMLWAPGAETPGWPDQDAAGPRAVT